MENYDPEFQDLASAGDILVAGFNFGTGSSREQAATSLKHCGLQLVIAGSFSETYKRNALNNGFLVIEMPGLIEDLRDKYHDKILTRRTGIKGILNFRISQLIVAGEKYSLNPIGKVAQELIVQNGLENWVKQKLMGQ
jgi:homoaconitate hydratase